MDQNSTPHDNEVKGKGFAGNADAPHATNPHRDLPSDPAVHNTIKEVRYISDVLAQLWPTSLPDDNFELYSAALRSVETRQDLTWLVVQESEIQIRVRNIAARTDRHRYKRNPIPDEPFNLSGRAQTLRDHWANLESSAPYRWEAAFDTVLIPPLLENGDDGHDTPSATPISLTAEKQVEVDLDYVDYLRARNNKVAYFKRTPPNPMAWNPSNRDTESVKEAWASIGGAVPSRHLSSKELQASGHFVPMYRSLNLEDVPILYVDPDAPEMSADEKQEYFARSGAKHAKRRERREKQKALQEQLKAEREVA